MLSRLFIASLFCLTFSTARAEMSVEHLKAQIVRLAKSYQGQPDPDQKLQQNLEVYVQQLLAKSSMPPVKDRISAVAGAWKQVWGPYDYRNDNGGVDPTLGVSEIYQVVFADGYYYNVAPLYPAGNPGREQISLLRGEFEIDTTQRDILNVRFTDYPGVEPRPQDLAIWELAAMAENGTLENKITIVPSNLVQQFFGGGTLEEIYTDHDLRLLYGKKKEPSKRRFLYVMTRVK